MKAGRLIIFIVLGLLVLMLVVGLYPRSLSTHAPYVSTWQMHPTSYSRQQSKQEWEISFLGDIMVHDTQIIGAKKIDGSYDFSPSFAYVQSYLKHSDYVIGNLETTLAGSDAIYSGYPRFNAPDELAVALREAGVDLLVHCNNHVLDKGLAGLIRTRQIIEETGMRYAGSRIHPDDDTVTYFDLDTTRFALITGTYGTNGLFLPDDQSYRINMLDEKRLIEDVLRAQQNAEFVMVFLHFGTEYQEQPNVFQINLSTLLIEQGADIVVGSHPHVVQTDGFIGDNIVVYSLGNFISAQNGAKRRTGMIYTFSIVKDFIDGSITVQQTEYLPVFTYRSNEGNRPYFLGSLDIEDNDLFGSEDRRLAQDGWEYLERTIQLADRVTLE